jgi:opacity protein-like surface antigen
MTNRLMVVGGAILLTVMGSAPAQAQVQDQTVHLTLGGGMATPLADVADRFRTGGTFTLGVTVEPDSPVGLQVEYGFLSLNGPETRIPLMATPFAAVTNTAVIESSHKVNYLVANALFRGGSVARFSPYAMGGGGMYHRSVALTTPDVGFTTYCDPYWYACYPTATEVDRVIGDRSTWNPGLNVGGGVAIRMGQAASFYIETRWHYAWGPTITDQNGVDHHVNGQYFPVTFGFKF